AQLVRGGLRLELGQIGRGRAVVASEPAAQHFAEERELGVVELQSDLLDDRGTKSLQLRALQARVPRVGWRNAGACRMQAHAAAPFASRRANISSGTSRPVCRTTRSSASS